MSGPRKPSDTARRRLAPLAVLPVFLTLEGKQAIVAGGSDAAAWKAELLAAAGAEVQVFAVERGDVMRRLLAEGAAAGSLVPHARGWTVGDFPGMVLGVCDAADTAEAVAFAAAGRAAGVPVNVIDDTGHCDFHFGSIVNRSPVVVGISTAGTAPVLAQAVRRRIETALPGMLGGWARLAGTVRAAVAERLPAAALRRAFWERFAELAFTGTAATPTEAGEIETLIAAVRGAPEGRVTLVGAGPGDAEFLTLKAMRALQAADVVLFDDLVGDEVLELARREARRMTVGKRGGRDSCRQEDINATMIALAKQGHHVVRLKSGDPMVFGRASEEIAELRACGIAVDVVPGITAALALAARLGVSLTHRDVAHSVRFITGHSKQGKLPDDLDWRGIADAGTTQIFYMAGGTAAALAERLIAAGLVADTPAVVAAALGRADERHWAGRLNDLATGVPHVGREAPVLIGVGRVFANCPAASGYSRIDRAIENRAPSRQFVRTSSQPR